MNKKKKIVCPDCGTDDFDVNKKETEGFCIASCGIWFKINKNGTTKIKGHCRGIRQ